MRMLGHALWLAVLPAAAALLGALHLLPDAMAAVPPALLAPAAAVVLETPLAILLFLALSLVARYWMARYEEARRARPDEGAQQVLEPHEPLRPQRRSTGLRQLVAFVGLVGLASALGLFVRGSVLATPRVLSTSMLPAVDVGDRLLVDKTAYGLRVPFGSLRLGGRAPRRGDMVVFSAPHARGGPAQLVKRIVGLPGDRVTMAGGRPIINGWPIPACDVGLYFHLGARNPGEVPEPLRGRLAVEFLDDRAYLVVLEPMSARFPGHTVAADEVFVLGDNRGQSADSRALDLRTGQGTGIPIELIEGVAERLLFGVGRDGSLDWSRIGAGIGLDPRLPGQDTADLREGISRCLRERPASSPPPPPALSLASDGAI